MTKESTRWFHLVSGKPQGPMSIVDVVKKIRNGDINSYDLVYKLGESSWKQVSDYGEFEALFSDKKSRVNNQWVVLRRLGDDNKKFEQIGPLSTTAVFEKISSNKVLQSDYVWQDGMKSWQKISLVGAFSKLFYVEPEAALPDPKVQAYISEPSAEVNNDEQAKKAAEAALEQSRTENLFLNRTPPEADGGDLTDPEVSLWDFNSRQGLFKGDVRFPKTEKQKKQPVKTQKQKDQKQRSKTKKTLPLAVFFNRQKKTIALGIGSLLVIVAVFYAVKSIPELVKKIRPEQGGVVAVNRVQPKTNNAAAKVKPQKVKQKTVESAKPKPAIKKASFIALKTAFEKSGRVLYVTTDASPGSVIKIIVEASAGDLIGAKSVDWVRFEKVKAGSTKIDIKDWNLPDGVYKATVSVEDKLKYIRVNNFKNRKQFYLEKRRYIKKQSNSIHKEKKRLFVLNNKLFKLVSDVGANNSFITKQSRNWTNEYARYINKIKNYSVGELYKVKSTRRGALYFPQIWKAYGGNLASARKLLASISKKSFKPEDLQLLIAQQKKLFMEVSELSVY